MLKIKSNSNNCYSRYTELKCTFDTGTSIYDDIIITSENHNLKENDVINFIRLDGSQIIYNVSKPVEKVIDKNTFTIKGFGAYQLLPISCKKYSYVEFGIKKHVLLFTFNEKNGHIFLTNKDNISVSGYYMYNQTTKEFDYQGKKQICPGDYVIYENYYLRQILENGNESDNLNLLVPKNSIKFEIIGGKTYYSNEIIIKSTSYGKDDNLSLYCEFKSPNNTDIVKNFGNIIITCDDVRFLYNGENPCVFGNQLQPNTGVFKIEGNLEIDLPIASNFDVSLDKESLYNNFYIDSQKSKNINSIIDYEKYPYVPMYYDGKILYPNNISADKYLSENYNIIDENLKPVKKIEFKLNFRERDFKLDDDGKPDYGTWQLNDELFWNNYYLANDGSRLVKKCENIDCDLLGYLGFTDDDVRYQKSALKKSFLRLSFYDSPDRRTQKLLFYSTIYFDTNILSSTYYKDLELWKLSKTSSDFVKKNKSIDVPYNELVYSCNIGTYNKIGSPLLAKMFCVDKYNTEASSDGFYLHLFDKLVSGNTCTTIYMKAEFNNAKNGKIVPLILPVNNKTNIPIQPTDKAFPRDYNNVSSIDMSSLINHMYVKVLIKYNYLTNNFVWFLPRKINDEDKKNGTITFTFFEPRINGYDTLTTLKNNGDITDSDLAYGEGGSPTWFDSNEGHFVDDTSGNYMWLDEDGNSEENSKYTKTYCLKTTAITPSDTILLDGVTLFNYNCKDKIKSIWIDGIKVSDKMFNDGVLTTNKFQLPDVPFKIVYENEFGEWTDGVFTPKTTQEEWDKQKREFYTNTDKKPVIIHSVNYYFKDNIKDSDLECIDELYLGKKITENIRSKQSIECKKDVADKIKTKLGDIYKNGKTLPKGMFSNIKSLRNVKFYGKQINTSTIFRITSVSSGTFNNCNNLIKIDNSDVNGALVFNKNSVSGCRSLKEVYFGNVQCILKQAFQGCYTLSNITFNQGLSYVGCGAFGNTFIDNVVLPKSIIRIGNSAFRRCYGLKKFSIEDIKNCSLESVGKKCFCDNAIQRYNLSKSSVTEKYKKYVYKGGTPSIVNDLINNNINCVFYNPIKDEWFNLSPNLSSNIIEHFKDAEYRYYLENSETSLIMSFEHWYVQIFH